MKWYFGIAGVLLLVAVSSYCFAEETSFDSSSGVLTVQEIKIDQNDTSYDAIFKLGSDGTFSLIDLKASSVDGKWIAENIPGTYRSDSGREFVFYDDGTGRLVCTEGDLDSVCQNVTSFYWVVDNSGSLTWGALVNSMHYRFIWKIESYNGNTFDLSTKRVISNANEYEYVTEYSEVLTKQ